MFKSIILNFFSIITLTLLMTDDKHWQNIGVQVAYTNNHKRGNLIFHQQEESDLAHELILNFFRIITLTLLMTDDKHWQNIGVQDAYIPITTRGGIWFPLTRISSHYTNSARPCTWDLAQKTSSLLFLKVSFHQWLSLCNATHFLQSSAPQTVGLWEIEKHDVTWINSI